MSIVQNIAEWIHARPDGAISAEVAEAFALTVIKASTVISQIYREPRFSCRQTHHTIVDANGKGRRLRRLYVDRVTWPQWHKTPVIGINDNQQVVRFASIHEAEHAGGFIRASITRCLNRDQATHGGYRWYPDTTTEATT